MIVPFAPGGSNSIARIIAEKLASSLGQPIVVDNRSGVGGIVGTETVAKATLDGHAL